MSAAVDPAVSSPFDALYRASADPWGTRTRWYERRKRALLLASLPHERYEDAYEAGCGNGHVTTELAPRCAHVLASDASPEAVALATSATAACANVVVERHRLPDDWPRRPFDLIVLSELLYFIDAAGRDRIADAARDSAGPSGVVVACDWRDPIDGYDVRGDDAHRHFERALRLPRAFEYADDDVLLTGWCADETTVARRDGLR